MDPYAALGIKKTATQDEIKDAYRNLAKKYHPDLNPGNPQAELKFKEINEANELLSDPKARAKYDRGEPNPFSGSTTGHPSSGPGTQQGPFYYYETQDHGPGRYTSSFTEAESGYDSSFFDSLFGQYRRAEGKQKGPTQGQDHLYELEISLKDVVQGAEKEISLPNGKKLRVKIPAGIQEGARLRFQGQGEAGTGDYPAGDAYVQIHITPDEKFKKVGDHLETVVPISLNEAVLGGEIQVPTLDGQVLMKIPSGISSGAKLRLRGKGFSTRIGGPRGDLLAIVQIVLPSSIDLELRNAIENWSRSHPYSPRKAA